MYSEVVRRHCGWNFYCIVCNIISFECVLFAILPSTDQHHVEHAPPGFYATIEPQVPSTDNDVEVFCNFISLINF